RARFVATGQTGIFIEGWGIAVDAVVADFVAGAAEQLVLQGAVYADVVLVEGQGSLIHPGYSGVTLGLLHGSCPDALILCHQATRDFIGDYHGREPWVRIPPLAVLVAICEPAAIGYRSSPASVVSSRRAPAPLRPRRMAAATLASRALAARDLAAAARRGRCVARRPRWAAHGPRAPRRHARRRARRGVHRRL